ncbi:ABC transporter ATP-binding protein [Bradyrhizobium erythrophlei]|uniref:ABC transporter ATP-binding protein n=1 Tax=Bradyrhizobium erythrophlei TaxID=1437360 RepID=UPI0035F099C2
MRLQVEGVSSHYDRIRALDDVNIDVAQGEIAALIGANGAGKTTLLNVISGVQPLSGGRLQYDGQDLAAAPAAERVRRGIVQVPEGRQVFAPLTVRENLELGAYTRPVDSIERTIAEVFELFPVLAARQSAEAGALSGGEQQMLAIGRALMSEPRLLLLDEPSLGLAPQVISFIFERVRELNEKGMSILLVEQNASIALELADRAYVLETGSVVMTGSGLELLGNPNVQSAYLGI